MMMHRVVYVYTCQNATSLEITCRGSYGIVCLVESKLGSLDSIEIQNFDILHLLSSHKKAKSRSGEIAAMVLNMLRI